MLSYGWCPCKGGKLIMHMGTPCEDQSKDLQVAQYQRLLALHELGQRPEIIFLTAFSKNHVCHLDLEFLASGAVREYLLSLFYCTIFATYFCQPSKLIQVLHMLNGNPGPGQTE